MSTGRKKPRCHTCGSPMAGHKRPNGGSFVCPAPASAPRHSTPRLTEAHVQAFADRIAATDGNWHWRNPNWVERSPDPVTFPREASPRPLLTRSHSPEPSIVSTEPTDSVLFGPSSKLRKAPGTYGCNSLSSSSNDSGSESDSSEEFDEYAYQDQDEDDKRSVSSSDSSTSMLDRVLASSEPLASLFATPTSEIPRVRCAADKFGLHVGLVRRPDYSSSHETTPRRTSNGKGKGKALAPSHSSSWWIVMGKNAQAVRHLLDVYKPRHGPALTPRVELAPFDDYEDPDYVSMPGTMTMMQGEPTQAAGATGTGTFTSRGAFKIVLATVVGYAIFSGLVALSGL